MFLNTNDALKEGPIIIVSQMSEEDQMQEFLSKAVLLFDWEKAVYNAVVTVLCV